MASAPSLASASMNFRYISQAQLDEIAVQWQGEIEALYSEIDRMYKDFQAEQILLTDEMKKKREDDIMEKEAEAGESGDSGDELDLGLDSGGDDFSFDEDDGPGIAEELRTEVLGRGKRADEIQSGHWPSSCGSIEQSR